MPSSSHRPDGSLPRVGVSACLLGQAVRYDGAHKRDPFVVDMLGPKVEWVPVCPELEAGLGVPRPPLQLVEARSGPRAVQVESRRDHTHQLTEFSEERVHGLHALDLSGFVLKRALRAVVSNRSRSSTGEADRWTEASWPEGSSRPRWSRRYRSCPSSRRARSQAPKPERASSSAF